jgi:hypothetical protein
VILPDEPPSLTPGAAADLVAGLEPGTAAGDAVAAADVVIDAELDRAVPSREAAVLA